MNSHSKWLRHLFRPALIASLLVVLPTASYPPTVCAQATRQPAANGSQPSTQQIHLLDQVIVPAYQSGNQQKLFEAVNRLIGPLDSDAIKKLDDHLQNAGSPNLASMMLEARIASWQGGKGFVKPHPLPAEVLLLMPEVQRRSAAVIKQVSALPVMSKNLKPPEKLYDYDDLFWLVKQQQKQAGFAKQVAKKTLELLKSARIQRTKLSTEERKQVYETFDTSVKKIAELHELTKERELILRLMRVDQSIQVLQSSDSVKDKLVAAHFIDIDGSKLSSVFKAQAARSAKPFLSSALNAEGLAETTAEKLKQARGLAGERINKSRLFFTGVHWWLRGRYGKGTHFYGLVKSPLALRSAAARQHVQMPYEMPRNDDPKYGTHPDRRHYYTWLWEERTLQVAYKGRARPLTNGPRYPATGPKPTTTSGTPTFGGKAIRLSHGYGVTGTRTSGIRGYGRRTGPVAYMQIPRGQYGPINRPYSWTVEDVYKRLGYGDAYKKLQQQKKTASKRKPRDPSYDYTTRIATYVPKQDPNLIYRLVGYIEYRNALDCLDGLIRYCSKEELAAFNELIQDRDEMVITINLSRSIQHAPSSFDQKLDPNDNFKRRGLKWVTALARAEVGAMMVGFTFDNKAFQRLASEYDRKEHVTILRDAMCAHYWALASDPMLKTIIREGNVNRTLAYLRRLSVARGFHEAAAVLGREKFNDLQVREWRVWNEQLRTIQASLVQRIQDFHRETTVTERK